MYTEHIHKHALYSSPAQRVPYISICWPAHPSSLPVCPLQFIHTHPQSRQVLLQPLTTFLYCFCHSFAHPVIPSLWHGLLVSLMSIEQVCKRRASHPLACLHTPGHGKTDEGPGIVSLLWEAHSAPWTETISVNAGGCQWKVFTGPVLGLDSCSAL